MSELIVTNEDPLNLDGTLDTNDRLQIVHSTGNLADYDQTVLAEHDDYQTTGGLVRVKLLDFSDSGNNWTLSAEHGGNSWSRGSDHAYFDFPHSSTATEVDVTATSDHSPAQSRERKIWVKTEPTDPLPDKP